MNSLKPEGSSPSHLSDRRHCSVFAQAVQIEQSVLGVLWENFPRASVRVVAAMDPITYNWKVTVGIKDQVHSFEVDQDLTDWHGFWSMVTEIKLQS